MTNQPSENSSTPSIRVLTHNIRTIPLLRFHPEKHWTARKHPLINQLIAYTNHADSLICLQEVLHRQLTDILDELNSTNTNKDTDNKHHPWEHIGCGRDGGQKGEHAPILYRSEIWDVEWDETRWLTESEKRFDRPCKGWDAAYRRIITAGAFRHRGSGRKVLVLNTHLDHKGGRSRFEGARKILQWVQEWFSTPDPAWQGPIDGVFLCGDFNNSSQDESDAYGVLTGPETLFSDSRMLLPEGAKHWEQGCSFTGFNDNPKDDSLIDYVLLGSRKEQGPWNVRRYDILPNRSDDGVYMSDHRAIVVDADLLSSEMET